MKSEAVPSKKLRPQPVVELLRKGPVAGEVAVFEKGGPDRVVVASEAQAFADGPARVADLQVQIPQDVEASIR